jgi:LmbE family N-acetylglucosaminyl deacetylase
MSLANERPKRKLILLLFSVTFISQYMSFKILLPFVGLLLTIASCNKKENVTQYAPIENYPDDTLLSKVSNKKAMIVIAHDDDMSAMTGTLSQLNKKGWEIITLSFPQTPERNEAHIKACGPIVDSVTFFSFPHEKFRNDIDKNETLYKAIPLEHFGKIFNKRLVQEELIKKVRAFNPSIIFTLDHIIGAYGHPEHVFISSLVLELAQADSINPSFIYQNVYTPHMIESIMLRHSKRMKEWGYPDDGWEHTKATYNVKGTPEPTTQVNIESEAEIKMDFLKSYNERERKTIGFYIPAFEDYSAKEYFKIFNREFFKVINTN